MPPVKLYFTPALLQLMFACTCWQVGQSRPTCQASTDNDQELITHSYAVKAQSFLRTITETLEKKHLFSGIDCSKQNIELLVKSSTPSLCAPKGSTCSGTVESNFNQDSCVMEIRKDLKQYYDFLIAQQDPDNVLARILPSLTDLMKNCRVSDEVSPTNDSFQMKAFANSSSTYDARLSLCKVLKGFQVRAITINRAIGYIRSVQTPSYMNSGNAPHE
ncbi:interleukin-12 subunit alpha-like [Gouania willdenowi]|uniref:interleukin-12 subunit alpha-like n=1 Tax=Gouania willdenowi TaxID=441366 RepID=UPI001054D617|nr:interleukin-12 subunit alpha-like [Gouania willdenowi]